MKKIANVYTLVLPLIFVAQSIFGSGPEILWLRLDRNFNYKDIGHFCSTGNMPDWLYFGAEIVDGKVQNALFKTSGFGPLSEQLSFNSEEIERIQLTKDSKGQYWIGSILLDARQLSWVFGQPKGSETLFSGCVPWQKLVTVNPDNYSYVFDLTNLEQVTSNMGKFFGQRKDGHYYQAELYFLQRRVHN